MRDNRLHPVFPLPTAKRVKTCPPRLWEMTTSVTQQTGFPKMSQKWLHKPQPIPQPCCPPSILRRNGRLGRAHCHLVACCPFCKTTACSTPRVDKNTTPREARIATVRGTLQKPWQTSSACAPPEIKLEALLGLGESFHWPGQDEASKRVHAPLAPMTCDCQKAQTNRAKQAFNS